MVLSEANKNIQKYKTLYKYPLNQNLSEISSFITHQLVSVDEPSFASSCGTKEKQASNALIKTDDGMPPALIL